MSARRGASQVGTAARGCAAGRGGGVHRSSGRAGGHSLAVDGSTLRPGLAGASSDACLGRRLLAPGLSELGQAAAHAVSDDPARGDARAGGHGTELGSDLDREAGVEGLCRGSLVAHVHMMSDRCRCVNTNRSQSCSAPAARGEPAGALPRLRPSGGGADALAGRLDVGTGVVPGWPKPRARPAAPIAGIHDHSVSTRCAVRGSGETLWRKLISLIERTKGGCRGLSLVRR